MCNTLDVQLTAPYNTDVVVVSASSLFITLTVKDAHPDVTKFEVESAGGYFAELPPQLKYTPFLSNATTISNIEKENSTYSYLQVTFQRMTLFAEPGDYKLGFFVVLRNNQSLLNTTYECAYVTSNVLRVQSYVWHMISFSQFSNAVIFAVGLLLIVLLTTICQKAFQEPLILEHANNPIMPLPKNSGVSSSASFYMPLREDRKFLNFKRFAFLENFLTLFHVPKSNLISKVGAPSVIYMRINFVFMIFSIIVMLLSCSVLLPFYLAATDFKIFQDVAGITFASLRIPTIFERPMNPKFLVYAAITVIIHILLMFLIHWLYVQSRSITFRKKKISKRNAVMIQNIDKEFTNKEQFVKHFKTIFGEHNIIDAHIAYHGLEIADLVEKKQKTEIKLARSQQEFQQTGVSPQIKGRDAVVTYELEIQRLNTKIANTIESYARGTGYGFVVFKTEYAAKECVRYYRMLKKVKQMQSLASPVQDRNWKISYAPESEDIQWKHLHYSPISRIFRVISGSILFLFIALIIFILISLIKFASQLQLVMNVQGDDQSILSFLTFIFDLVYMYTIPKLIAILNQFIFPIIIGLVNFQKHITYGTARKFTLVYLLLFMYTSVLIAPYIIQTVVFAIDKGSVPKDMHQKFYTSFSSEMVSMMVSHVFMGRAIYYTLLFFKLVIEFIQTRKMTRPEFDFETHYSMQLIVLVCIMKYGTLMPIVAIYGAAAFVATYLCDRWLLLYLFAKERTYNAKYIEPLINLFSVLICVNPLITMVTLIPTFQLTLYIFLGALFLFLLVLILLNFVINRCILKRIKKLRPLIVVDRKGATMGFDTELRARLYQMNTNNGSNGDSYEEYFDDEESPSEKYISNAAFMRSFASLDMFGEESPSPRSETRSKQGFAQTKLYQSPYEQYLLFRSRSSIRDSIYLNNSTL